MLEILQSSLIVVITLLNVEKMTQGWKTKLYHKSVKKCNDNIKLLWNYIQISVWCVLKTPITFICDNINRI